MALYPEISNPICYELEVDLPHKVYVEECGNPNGIPVIFIHGGPGSGCNPSHRQYFDPAIYRIVLFDQRGCGRSSPHGCLDKNTTHDLIADMEVIRNHLKISRWLLFAGSWGVTLALLYAQTYKERVLGMILRGSFLASKRDLDWFFKDGVNRIFPELWKNFNTRLTKLNDNESLLQSYHRCLFADDRELNAIAALSWLEWTDSIVTWSTPESDLEAVKDKMSKTEIDRIIRKVRLEAHYAINHYFLDEDHLLKNCHKIQGLPTILVHGRRDITCPVESSWRIHNALAGSDLRILANAGHLASEPEMVEALVTATDDLASILKS